MNAYPIKDFRDAAQYPNHKGLNAWRWEFLRRNADYQTLYQAHKDDIQPPPAVWDFGVRALHDPMLDNAYRELRPLAGIVRLPTFEDVEKFEKVHWYTAERALAMILETLTGLQHCGGTLVTIDRTLPIEPQLDAIRKQVTLTNKVDNEKPPLGNLRLSEWPAYLRIMDARAVGASFDEIAAVIYPETDNSYPDQAGRKRVIKADERAKFLAETFACRKFTPEK